MEKSFDFGALLRNNEKKHKGKPTQFVSVAGGVLKRLQTTIKNRKSNRLTIFDQTRNLPTCASPVPVLEAQSKVEHRRQQLDKWKQEKAEKKKEAAALKKKPFLTGVPHTSLKFVPPPPPPKPGFSGRVTRSQTAKITITKTKPSPKKRTTKSFAPKNASFKPPELKNFIKLPALAPPSKTKKTGNLAFEPVLRNSVKHTRSKTINTKTETKPTRKPVENRSISTVKGNGRKITPKRTIKTIQSSSSSSDMESSRIVNRIKTPGPAKSTKNVKNLTSKVLALSEETSSSESDKQTRKSLTSISSNSLSSDSSKLTSDTDQTTSEQNTVIIKNMRKSVPSSLSPAISLDSSEKSSKNDSYTTPNKLKHVPRSESSSEEKLRSPKSPLDLPLTPSQIETAKKISPCVTLSRGKDNARKEMKWKINEGMFDDDTSDIENVDQFRRQHASEIKRITEMCEAWDKVAEQTALPEPVQEAVLAAVGQARLLMSQKMQQFASLVERCARPDPATALVTPADLLGFWDMVFMQVENVDMRFKKLEELRARNWVEDKPVEAARKVAKPPAAAARKTRPAANSRIRDMIAAARKAKKELDSSSPTSDSTATTGSESPSTKTFEAGFFSVRTPVKSPVPRTPNALLKAVLSSEAKKASASRNSASFAMLRASVLGKNVEYEGIAPLPQTPQLTPINLYATPGRSILKSSNLSSKSVKKTIKLVLFNESDNDIERTIALQELNTKEPTNPIIDGEEDINLNTDLFSMDIDKNTEQKENSSKPRLVRQDAMECQVMTRSRRKSLQQAQKPEIEANTEESTAGKTPRRTARKKKSVQETETGVKEKTPKRSTRKKALQEVESNVIEEMKATPKRSNRLRKSAPLLDLLT